MLVRVYLAKGRSDETHSADKPFYLHPATLLRLQTSDGRPANHLITQAGEASAAAAALEGSQGQLALRNLLGPTLPRTYK